MPTVVIPSKGSSVRFGGRAKSLVPILGKPAILWTIDRLVESGVYDRIVVASDSLEVLEASATEHPVVTMLRPPELSDKSQRAGRVAEWVYIELGLDEEISSLCYPTAVLLRPEDIRGAYEAFSADPGAKALMVICEPSTPPMGALVKTLGGYGEPFFYPDRNAGGLRVPPSEEWPVLYEDTGSLYLGRWPLEHDYYPERGLMVYEVDRVNAWDVDNPLDVEMTELLLANQLAKQVTVED